MNTPDPTLLNSPSIFRKTVRFLERGLLLFGGSGSLGVLGLMFLTLGSDFRPAFELASHFSFHAFVFCVCLLIAQGLLYLIRRNSSTSGDRWRRRLIFLLIPTIYFSWVVAPWRLLPFASNKTADDAVKILIWNALLSNDSAADVKKLVEREKPDIVALIEVNPEMERDLEELKKEYPFWHSKAAWNSGGMTVLTRLPDTEFTVIYPGDHWMPAIELTHKPTGAEQPVRILTVHTVSPQPANGRRTIQRNKQLASISKWASEQTIPAMIVGDFNITPWSPSFWRLMRNGRLQDSSWYRGYLPSFPATAGMFGIPIDQALANDKIEFLTRRNLYESHSSDHCPVVVEFRVKK
jgi:endonuclease/exonuclease/phosphatase (EEP) superfamily protein YafD